MFTIQYKYVIIVIKVNIYGSKFWNKGVSSLEIHTSSYEK